jgi:hypothetical protein
LPPDELAELTATVTATNPAQQRMPGTTATRQSRADRYT